MNMTPKPGQLWQYHRDDNCGSIGSDRIAFVISYAYGDSMPGFSSGAYECITFWRNENIRREFGPVTRDKWWWPDENWELVSDV